MPFPVTKNTELIILYAAEAGNKKPLYLKEKRLFW
jgi:hypothetical protein